ncbi:MAG: molybdenum cofactor biosynthesis protein MoaE [Mucilaginibacter sp.]|uniref:molybdenum cofactor biosynthesis protein MoaE n=1 Tax=Mucilaginibacter sp. TaxID=1882438 RepID=UPI0035692A00
MEDKMQTQIEIHTESLNIQQCIDWVMSPDSGGIDVFIGTVRNATKGKTVLKLDFEAYNKMAINEINKITEQVFKQWPVQKVLVHHRSGTLQVGEIPVIIAVSAAHRDAAFEACRYIIDTLKQTVPIWKKEFFEDGEVWVAAHP